MTSIESIDDELLPVWKALADPTRRTLLDLLRVRAMTTGQLAARFDLTRYAVMKHLGVLVDAGLVFIRREGRERWNHLNPIPIQQIYRRWIRPFEAQPADSLLRLKAVAETPEQGDTMSQTAEKKMQAFDIRFEVRIGAPVAKVWNALTKQTSAWWPGSFYVNQEAKGVVLEPRVGGRVYEDWGNGEGAMWAWVNRVREGEVLEWVGDLSASYGGPARTITSFTLVGEGDETLLQFRDTPYGNLSDGTRAGMDEGWKFLVEGCLKPFAETGKQPERPDGVGS